MKEQSLWGFKYDVFELICLNGKEVSKELTCRNPLLNTFQDAKRFE